MGVLKPEEHRKWDPGGGMIRNDRIYNMLASTLTSANTNDSMVDASEQSRTELDSHANMPVVRRNAYILAELGKTVDVSPFTPDY